MYRQCIGEYCFVCSSWPSQICLGKMDKVSKICPHKICDFVSFHDRIRFAHPLLPDRQAGIASSTHDEWPEDAHSTQPSCGHTECEVMVIASPGLLRHCSQDNFCTGVTVRKAAPPPQSCAEGRPQNGHALHNDWRSMITRQFNQMLSVSMQWLDMRLPASLPHCMHSGYIDTRARPYDPLENYPQTAVGRGFRNEILNRVSPWFFYLKKRNPPTLQNAATKRFF